MRSSSDGCWAAGVTRYLDLGDLQRHTVSPRSNRRPTTILTARTPHSISKPSHPASPASLTKPAQPANDDPTDRDRPPHRPVGPLTPRHELRPGANLRSLPDLQIRKATDAGSKPWASNPNLKVPPGPRHNLFLGCAIGRHLSAFVRPARVVHCELSRSLAHLRNPAAAPGAGLGFL